MAKAVFKHNHEMSVIKKTVDWQRPLYLDLIGQTLLGNGLLWTFNVTFFQFSSTHSSLNIS